MFDDLLIILIIVWAALPLVLIPAVIILATKNSKLKKLLEGSGISPDTGNVPKKERKPLSFSIILIVGVIFVIVAGVVFATSGWRYMSGLGLKTSFLRRLKYRDMLACRTHISRCSRR